MSTSRWDAADYARVGSFVSDLGSAALDLLDPQAGERVLDIGCGEGALTAKIAARGARVIGVDSSPSMVEAARARGLDARLMAAEDMAFDRDFDAAFTNATLHWVLERERAARNIWFALKSGGRFAGEMGGEGNLARLREALDEQLIVRGYVPPVEATNWYPSVEDFTRIYEAAGFVDVDARIIERPTRLDHGIAAWVMTFRKGWLERAEVPADEHADIAEAVEAAFADPIADYVRLRFIMRKN